MKTATFSIDGNTHPIRAVMLIGLGAAMGLTVLALLPLLIHQTILNRDALEARQIRIIPKITEPFMELEEKLEKPEEPEPEPPPEPEIEMKPPEIPEIEPPDMPEPELPDPEIDSPMPEVIPIQEVTPAPIHIETPPLSAINVKGMKVKSTPPQAARGFVKAAIPNALPRPVAKVKPMKRVARPVNKIRFDMGEVDKKPSGISTIQPAYPLRARRRGIEGRVTIKFLVDREGNVHDLAIIDARPANIFEKTIRNTVPKWRFKPAIKDGKKVETWVQTTVKFQLEK